MENKIITDETIKSLTKEELTLLKYFNEGENRTSIKKKYGITLYTNDPRVMSLFYKFDVYDRIELIKKYRLYLEEKSGKTTKILVQSTLLAEDSFQSEKIKEETNCNLKYLSFPLVNKEIHLEKFFDQICSEGLKKRYGENLSQEIKERFDKEAKVIKTCGFMGEFVHLYFLIQYAKNNNIILGTGRGSCVGSLICYILEITNIDPIKYNLVFERFLNTQRILRPDIELDTDREGKEKLINYILHTFGGSYCAFDSDFSYPLEVQHSDFSYINLKTIIYVSEHPIGYAVPLGYISDNTYLALCPEKVFRQSPCLKFTIHILDVLDKLKQANTALIPLNDKKTFEFFQTGENIFEFGEEEIRTLAKKLKPDSINDLSALYTLGRESTISVGMTDEFINAKFSKRREYYHPLLKPILEETYGQIIYQEQIFQILNVLGDFSLETAGIIRIKMAKKLDCAEIEQEFIKNAREKGLKKPKAKELWDKLYLFTPYCFMKSHTISFSTMAYYDAYLQVNQKEN